MLESTQNSLDDLWQLEFPQKRMAHLLDICANQIARYVQVKTSKSKVTVTNLLIKIEKNLPDSLNMLTV